mgnify:FL=1|jgi:hypothetical protein|tara:strand:- start:2612 stop:2923 length:312 start_codon:yes stop_codon:yes gene_type:complete
MCAADDGFIMVDTDNEEDLGLFPVEEIDFSVDTEWYFEGAWLSLVSYLDGEYPSMSVGEAMASQDDDGHLGVWARFEFIDSVMWLRVMTFSPFHWVWKSVECN